MQIKLPFFNNKEVAKQEEPKADNGFKEIGDSGLKRYSGYIDDEFLRQLSNSQKYRTYREMRDNDAVIGGIMYSTEIFLRNVSWESVPAENTPEAEEVAEFVETCMNDMEMTFDDVISEVATMLTYGFAPMEEVYKRRSGMSGDTKSKYDDGRIGWNKIALRAQDTIESWKFSENGEIEGLTQTKLNGGNVFIPIEKLLLFRTTRNKNNPEGRSILRNCYTSWYYKKNIQSIEAIGIERDLAGLPVAHVPPEILNAEANTEEAATLSAVKDIIRNIRRDEQEGVVWPMAHDENGKEMYKLELLSSGGNRQFDTDKIITRYDNRIASSILADFIMLGQDGVGSLALSKDKTDLYIMSLRTWLEIIASVFNRYAVPRLMEVNGIPHELAPKIEPAKLEKEDVLEWARSVEALTGVGVLMPTEELREKAENMIGVQTAER